MMSPLPDDPSTAVRWVNHLSRWGELAAWEVAPLGGGGWHEVLLEAGLLMAVPGIQEGNGAWALTPNARPLLSLEGEEALRWICFRIPEYRQHLIGILAEGLASASRAGMLAQVEEWTGNAILPYLTELNQVLDSVEQGEHRLVDLTPEALVNQCRTLPGRAKDYRRWDERLLGRAGRPSELFDFVLSRFAPLAVLTDAPLSFRPQTLLRPLPLNEEDGMALGPSSLPAAWNTRRRTILSGIALHDELGKALFDMDAPLRDVLPRAAQDGLLEQPYYKAVVHLAISAWRAPLTFGTAVRLELPVGSGLHDVLVAVGDQSAIPLATILGRLVAEQDVDPLEGEECHIPSPLMSNLMRNLLAQNLLILKDEELRLHPDFQSSLMSSRMNTVFRPGKHLQERMTQRILSIVGSMR